LGSVIIDLWSNPRSAQITFLIHAKYRVGYSYRGRRYAYNILGTSEKGEHHAAEHNLELLKALGIGLINNLKEVELCDQENHLNKKSFNLPLNSISDLHYIYSKRWLNYYLSIAIPEKVTLGFIRLTSENYTSF